MSLAAVVALPRLLLIMIRTTLATAIRVETGVALGTALGIAIMAAVMADGGRTGVSVTTITTITATATGSSVRRDVSQLLPVNTIVKWNAAYQAREPNR